MKKQLDIYYNNENAYYLKPKNHEKSKEIYY